MVADFARITQSVGHNTALILDRPPIAMLKRLIDPTVIEMFLAKELQRLKEIVNIDARLTLQDTQIPLIASQLIELFPNETLEDFVMCFKRGATGFYGPIFRLDAPVLIEWMRGTDDRGKRKGGYLDEKYSLIEAQLDKERQKRNEENTVDYAAFIKRREAELAAPPPPPSNQKENNYQLWKLQRENDPWAIFQKKLSRAGSEFYKDKQGSFNLSTQYHEHKIGEEIRKVPFLAESEEDAKAIYLKATEE
jgi:hypothetical protein